MIVRALQPFRAENGIDFCIANGENLAGGAGMTGEAVNALFEAGVDVITSGDHAWKKKDIIAFMEANDRLLRPANFSPRSVGRGYATYKAEQGHRIGVVNVLGRAFMAIPSDCPFRAADEAVTRLKADTSLIFVDFHGEATSEKMSMGWHLDGQVSAVVGTHTHVQTADERILPNGTAYITDLGMTGPYDSVIGRRSDRVLKYLLTQMPTHFDVAKRNVKMCGVVVTVDVESGLATEIERVQLLDAETVSEREDG